MRTYKIWNTSLKTYVTGGGGTGVWDTVESATRSSPYAIGLKKNLEIHGFELTKTSVRRNDNGGPWGKEVAEVEENKL